MGKIFKIGVLQQAAGAYEYEKNMKLVLEGMEAAKKSGADLLLLPECFITGYALPCGNEQAISCDGPLIQKICSHARKWGIGIVATALTKGKRRPKNSAFVIDKQGKILMQYDKVHTCDFSDESCLEHGSEFRVCRFEGIALGVMICYDREYPESARVLMLKGAELILVPNDCGSMKPRLNVLEARAYENMTGVVMANPPGENAGRSCAFSPIAWDRHGNCREMCIFQAGEREQGLFFADYDIEELRSYRKREMMGNTFRKVEAYGALLSSAVEEPFIRQRGEARAEG